MVLDLVVEPLTELENDVCPFKVTSSINNLTKIVDHLRPLDILQDLEVHPQSLNLILGAKFDDQVFNKLAP